MVEHDGTSKPVRNTSVIGKARDVQAVLARFPAGDPAALAASRFASDVQYYVQQQPRQLPLFGEGEDHAAMGDAMAIQHICAQPHADPRIALARLFDLDPGVADVT